MHNLISLFALDLFGYYFKFRNNCFSLYKSNRLVDSSTVFNGMYTLKLDSLFSESLLMFYHIVGMEHNMANNFFFLVA